jgi:hypothetical protein
MSAKLVRHCVGHTTSFTLRVTNVTEQAHTMYVTIDGKRGSPTTVGGGKTSKKSIGDNGTSTTTVTVVVGKSPFFSKKVPNC